MAIIAQAIRVGSLRSRSLPATRLPAEILYVGGILPGWQRPNPFISVEKRDFQNLLTKPLHSFVHRVNCDFVADNDLRHAGSNPGVVPAHL
jgi:hypothetical protein